MRRLFPFGERCFEAAVYVTAASMGVRELHFIAAVADFGPKVVQCIGIFFTTRVLIELLQVLLCEAFGQNREEENADQKGRTLVPLLHSVSQYVLYFGSAMLMLDVVGLDIALAIQRSLYLESREPGFAPAPLLEHLVTAGYLGRKAGRGFRDYSRA